MSSEVDQVLSEVVGKRLLGELLTTVDASSSDKEQRNAIKSLVRRDVHKCLTDLMCRLEVIYTAVGKATEEKVEEA